MVMVSNVLSANVYKRSDNDYCVEYTRTHTLKDTVIKDSIGLFRTEREAIDFKNAILEYGIDIGE